MKLIEDSHDTMELFDELTLTVAQITEMAEKGGKSVSEVYIRRLLQEKKYQAEKVGRAWRVPLSEAKRLLKDYLPDT